MSLLTTSKAAARLVSRRCATNNGVASERSITLKNSLIGAVRNKQTAGPGIPSGVLSGWYNVFGKTNSAYAMWIVMGVLAGEFLTGTVTDSLWASANQGKTFDSVDWSKFAASDDDDEDDDDDDDDEEEEEEEEEDDDE